jgi:hypothetical protein
MHPEGQAVKEAVAQAIREIEADYPGHAVEAYPDAEGGAYVRVHALPFGDKYEPNAGWVAFRIVYSYPVADVYPHYLLAGLRRRDGKPLGEAFSAPVMDLGGKFKGPSTMVSRKSNKWNASRDTASTKLHMVLEWIRNRP